MNYSEAGTMSFVALSQKKYCYCHFDVYGGTSPNRTLLAPWESALGRFHCTMFRSRCRDTAAHLISPDDSSETKGTKYLSFSFVLFTFFLSCSSRLEADSSTKDANCGGIEIILGLDTY